MNEPIMFLTVFIGLAILFFVAAQILGTDALGDCTNLNGYNSTATGTTPIGSNPNVNKYLENSWAASCYVTTQSVIDAFNLMGIVFMVLAAVMIMRIIGWLG